MVSLVPEILEAVVARMLALCWTVANSPRGGFHFFPMVASFRDKASTARCAVVKHDFCSARQDRALVEKPPRNTDIGSVEIQAAAHALVQCVGDGFNWTTGHPRPNDQTEAFELMCVGDVSIDTRIIAGVCCARATPQPIVRGGSRSLHRCAGSALWAKHESFPRWPEIVAKELTTRPESQTEQRAYVSELTLRNRFNEMDQ